MIPGSSLCTYEKGGMAMKRLSISVRIIVIVCLVITLFMLIDPPALLSNPRNLLAKPTKDYVPLIRTDYGALFANILALSVVAALALIALSLLSSKRKDKEKEDQHRTEHQ